jgi:dTDP-glucose 4,6-dehydratase
VIGQYVEKLIPKTCKLINLGRKIPLHNKGTPKRIWLHAKDTASAIIQIIGRDDDGHCTNQIYNISGNIELPNIEIVEKIWKLIIKNPIGPLDMYCDFTYSRDGQDIRYSLDDSKLKKLGWEPKCELDKELPSVVEYYQNNFIW